MLHIYFWLVLLKLLCFLGYKHRNKDFQKEFTHFPCSWQNFCPFGYSFIAGSQKLSIGKLSSFDAIHSYFMGLFPNHSNNCARFVLIAISKDERATFQNDLEGVLRKIHIQLITNSAWIHRAYGTFSYNPVITRHYVWYGQEQLPRCVSFEINRSEYYSNYGSIMTDDPMIIFNCFCHNFEASNPVLMISFAMSWAKQTFSLKPNYSLQIHKSNGKGSSVIMDWSLLYLLKFLSIYSLLQS